MGYWYRNGWGWSKWTVVRRIYEGPSLTYLSVTGELLLSLLVVVFCIGIFSSPDSGIIHFDSRVPILHHHPSLR